MSEVQDLLSVMKAVGELRAEIEGLRAENKCLREDRESWRQLAMSNTVARNEVNK